MTQQEIYNILKEKFGDEIIEFSHELPSDPYIVANRSKIDEICLFLRDEENLNFDYLVILSGMDYIEKLGVVYHLYSIKHKHRLTIKVFLSKDDPHIPTVEKIWRSADWHEREAWDMYGIIFDGHHNLIRILCPYDWEGFPLRKDYKTPEEYHGIKVPY